MKISKIYFLCLVATGCGKNAKMEGESRLGAILPATSDFELELGRGTNADTLDKLDLCVETSGAVYTPADGQPEVITDSSQSVKSLFEVKSISSYADIDKFTDISVSAKIKTATYGGGFSYNQTEAYALTSDQAMVGIQGNADFGRWLQSDAKLKPEYATLYQSNPAEFFRRCGTEYVSGYRMGQGIKVLLSTASKSTYEYEKISASVNASVNTGTVKGDFNASFLNVASSLLKMGSLQVEVRSYGSGGLDIYKGLIKSQSDVSTLSDQIATIVGGMSPSKSVRYQFLTSPYPGVDTGDFKTSAIMREHRAQVLASLYNDYRRLSQDLNRASTLVTELPSIVTGWGELCKYATAQTGSCEDFVSRMNTLRDNIRQAIGRLDTLSKECAAATDTSGCKTSDAADVRINDLTVKTWEQQYKQSLIHALLIAGTNPG